MFRFAARRLKTFFNARFHLVEREVLLGDLPNSEYASRDRLDEHAVFLSR
jgi:hypothetical protein